MNLKKIIKIFKCFYHFKNPITVINFYRGKFKKGELIKILPWRGKAFYIARNGDLWLLDKIINHNQVKVENISSNKTGYIIENDICLRQGTSDTFIYKEIFIDKCYEKFVNYLTNKSIVIDAGAHIGLFGLYCSPKCNKVFSFEPHKDNYNLAIKNIKNKNINNIIIFNLAIWSASDEIMKISNNKDGQTGEHAIKIDNNDETGIHVKTISVQDIFLNNEINYCDLLKMDIEGAEYAAIFSIPNEIYEKIGHICIEYHPDVEKKHTIDDLMIFLKEKDFLVEKNIINKSTGILNATKIVNNYFH